MKNSNSKGITLIALVVTIIVLLILAGITITMLFGENGIIKKAQDASEAAKNAQDTTAEGLRNLENSMNEALSGNGNGSENVENGKWTVKKDGTVTNGTQSVKIGDYIQYNCTPVKEGAKTSYTSYAESNASADKNEGRTSGYTEDQVFNAADYATGEWRVLGADDEGHLLIISAINVPIASGGVRNNGYCLQGQKGYTNGIAELNAISEIYGNGIGAVGARSITVDQVDKITGYNPNNIGVRDHEKSGTGTRYGSGNINEYQNSVTYYWDGTDKPYYKYTTVSGEVKTGKLSTAHTNFTWYDGTEWRTSAKPTDMTKQVTEESKMKEIATLNNNYYSYHAVTLSDPLTTLPNVGISSSSAEYSTLLENSYSEGYWLLSSYINTYSTTVNFGILNVFSVGIYGNDLYSSRGFGTLQASGVRPVVSLKSDISFTSAGTKEGTTFAVYDIQS